MQEPDKAFWGDLEQNLAWLEAKRKRLNVLKKVGIGFTVVFGLAAYLAYWFGVASLGAGAASTFLYGLVLGAASFSFAVFYPMWQYNRLYKKHVVGAMLKAVAEDFEYIPNGHLDYYYFDQAAFFNRPTAGIKGDDFIHGKVNDFEILMSNLKASYQFTSDDSNALSTMFNGLFVVIKNCKHVEGRTVIAHDTVERLHNAKLAIQFQARNSSRGQVYYTNHPEFEHYFAVHTDNLDECKKLLDMEMRARILVMRNRLKCPLYISFFEDKVFIGADTRRRMFEGKLKEPLKTSKRLLDDVEDLVTCLNAWDYLDLKPKA